MICALAIAAGAQSQDSLIAEASQPVTVEFAIGVSLSNATTAALSQAGLLRALPHRISASALRTPGTLAARSAAERSLSDEGPSIISDLLEAEIAQPVGLWIAAGGAPDSTLVRGEIRGLNIVRILTGMGSGALAELESISAESGPIGVRAGTLHHELSQLDVTILSSGLISVEGETSRIEGLADAVSAHELAQRALVVAPGDIPLNMVVPVLNALRAAGLSDVEIQATPGAVVTISDQNAGG